MAAQRLFFRSHSMIQEFDRKPGEGLSDRDGEGDGESRPRQVVSIAQYTETNFMLVALIDHLCAIYGTDEIPHYQLYKVLVKTLVRAKILRGFGTLDEASSLRAQYNVAFSKLLKSAIATTKQKMAGINIHDRAKSFYNPRLNITQPLVVPPTLNNIITHNTSRYHEDFNEIKKVGYGAYGNVYKVKNRLDKCEYAIKKISFESSEPDLWLKIINEVKLLAQLNHKHVVRYHNAWIEYENPSLLGTFSDESDTSNLLQLAPSMTVPAIEYNSLSPRFDSGDQEESDGIVFEHSRVNVGSQPEEVSPVSTSGSESVSIVSSPSTDGIGRPSYPTAAVVVLHIQMELCTHTLKEWIQTRNNKPRNASTDKYSVVDTQRNLQLLRQILKGISFIHSHNLMHRDIKPKNLFLSPGETLSGCEVAKVGDFGLARHDSTNSEPLTPHPGWKKTPDKYTCGVGTTIYAAPEQLDTSIYTQKCDMYSMGLVVFEMYEPFNTEMERITNLQALRAGILPAEFCTRWPKLTKLVELLLSGTPSLRPSACELLESELFNNRDHVISKLRLQNSTLQNEKAELRRHLANKDAEIAMLRKELVSLASKEQDA